MKTNVAPCWGLGLVLLSGVAIASLSSCSSVAGTSDSKSAPAVATASGPTDPEIAHVVVTANTIDIEAAELARSKSNNQQVREFANRMMIDHSAVNEQAVELATHLGVTPKDNAISQSLRSGANENISNLRGRSGEEFDRAYADHEVVYHQAVLDAIDTTLIPSAKNEELKALIVQVRPAIEAHLGHAKQLQASVSK